MSAARKVTITFTIDESVEDPGHLAEIFADDVVLKGRIESSMYVITNSDLRGGFFVHVEEV